MQKKWVQRGAVVAGVVVAGALGTSWWMGPRIERDFRAALDEFNAQPMLQDLARVELVGYERGLFSAKAQTRWVMLSKAHEALEAGDADDEGEPEQEPPAPGAAGATATVAQNTLTAAHDIWHGPLPWGAAAQIGTSFDLPPDADAKLKTAFNGKAPLHVSSRMGWLKSAKHQITAAPVKLDEEGMRVDWAGLTGTVSVSSDHRSLDGKLSMPSLVLANAKGEWTIKDGEVSADMKQPEGQSMWVGPSTMKLASVSGKLPTRGEGEPDTVALTGLSQTSESSIKDDLLTSSSKLQLKSLEARGFKADELELDMSMRKFDAKAMDALQRLAFSNNRDEMLSETPKLMQQMLTRQPEIEIKRLRFRTADGEATATALISYAGDASKPFNPMTDLKGQLQLNAAKPLVLNLMAPKAKGDQDPQMLMQAKAMTEQQVASLVQAGMLVDDGKTLSAKAAVDEGKVMVNDKPLEERLSAMR